jgi:hypothetical protein
VSTDIKWSPWPSVGNDAQLSWEHTPLVKPKPFDTATSSGAAMSEHKDPHRTDGIRHKETPLVAERLLLLQEVLEGTGRGASARMAERLGITPHRWSNVLRASPLSIGLAHRIVLTFPGVSLDWLYLGRPGGLGCEQIAAALRLSKKALAIVVGQAYNSN